MERGTLNLKLGIIAGLFLAIFSLYPQFKMLYLRGDQWNGHYAYNDIDEVAYASYLKALIDGRPRKNDPYTGRDDAAEDPQPESLFSIQFAGPYTIALPARLLGVGTPWAMTISGAVAAFLTALAIFWLLGHLTGDALFALAGSLVVLAGGALFAGEGAIGEILETSYAYPYFPGFRRYVPAMAFPAFFLLVGLVWKLLALGSRQSAVGSDHERQRLSASPLFLILAAALAFGYTVFSYFYIWTTGAAWLGCLGLCWIAARPDGWLRDLRRLGLLSVACGLILLPYAYLLSRRSHTMDDVQMLVLTHAPDLVRPPEWISFVVLILLGAGILSKMFAFRDSATLFAISLALTPIVVFNQQVITGRSLQPIHYQVFIGNYVAGLAIVVTLGLFWRRSELRTRAAAKAALIAVAVIAGAWGFVECHYTVRILDEVNVIRDEAYPVGMRLAELGREDADARRKTVLYFGIAEADDLPTLAPHAVLWARHQHVFAGVDWEENKRRYYQQLYYQRTHPIDLAEGMKRGHDFVSMIALFGWGRHTDRLNAQYQPLTFGEIDAEAARFAQYARAFDATAPGSVPLDYLVTRSESAQDLLQVDHWYERDEGEVLGKYVLYKLRLRAP
ncbi:MAG TPA: hypothetical protein VNA17_00640 [Pyrinomonadaceae bacterium]|nr:hypothetical protein [Pyrinomonadaceae bacterium]